MINCYKLFKSANSPAALISVTNEANVVKIQNINISHQQFTVKDRLDFIASDTTCPFCIKDLSVLELVVPIPNTDILMVEFLRG